MRLREYKSVSWRILCIHHCVRDASQTAVLARRGENKKKRKSLKRVER